jgi:hypothetical protein
MDEPIPRGFRIVGISMMLAFSACAGLPPVVFMGGGRSIVATVMVIGEFVYDWGALVAGALACAGTILLIVRWVNRRPHAS